MGSLLGRDVVVRVVQQSPVPCHLSFEVSETAPVVVEVTWSPWVVVALSSSSWLCYTSTTVAGIVGAVVLGDSYWKSRRAAPGEFCSMSLRIDDIGQSV